MARSASSTSLSSSSSRKVCPANKFSFMSGCMTWATVLAFFSLFILLVICFLIMSKKSLRRSIKNSNVIEEHRRGTNLSINGKNINNDNNENNENSEIEYERINERFEPNDSMRSPNEGTGTITSDRIKYDINVNIRDVNPESPNRNMISYDNYEANKNIERIINPILPPERSYQNTYGTPINIPSRGPMQAYQQVGIMYKENIENNDKMPGNNTDSNILPLFGRPTFNGSNKWNYYTSSDKFQNFKLPISIDGRKCDDDLGCNEIRSGDMLTIPSYNGRFRVEIYNFDKPRYIPYIY